MYLEMKDLSKSFDGKEVVCGLNLSMNQGEILCLLGASGCGKTTTLRMAGGFLEPDRGHIYLDGEDITKLPPERRPVSTVFQSYALFPHMTALQNVMYGLKFQGMKKKEAAPIAMEELKTVGLSGYETARIGELSGGQQQRVALARAMATGPKILLLDEPLSNLDAGLRVQLREELKELQKKLGITMVFVTHDQEEALSLSDKIVVMEKGVAVQTGTPREIYFSPVSRYVASFVGKANYIEENGRVQIVRPEDVWMEMDPSGDYTVRSASFMGAHTLYELENGSNVIKADLFGREGSLFSVGDRVRAGWGSRKDGSGDCRL